jgi:hypothetical protein
MIIELLHEALADFCPDTNQLIKSLTLAERKGIDDLAASTYALSTGTRSQETIYTNCQDGKLGEYAIKRHLEGLGFDIKQNNEQTTKEYYWDLSLTAHGVTYLIEIKRQLKISNTINFTRAPDQETMCMKWRKFHALIAWVPTGEFRPGFGGGKSMQAWCVLSNEVLDPTRKIMESLTFRPVGFCINVAKAVEQNLGKICT